MNSLVKLITFTPLVLFACSAAVVSERPAGEASIVPASPGPTYVWVGDSWSWDNTHRVYILVPGAWVEPKRKSSVWVNGRWVHTRNGWKYVRGHWRHR